MKRIYYILFVFIISSFVISSCNEDEILKEVPVDFISPENAFVTFEDFQSATYALLDQAREVLSSDERVIMDMHYGTDIGVNNTPNVSNWFGSYPAYLTSNASFVQWHWAKYYKLISSANIILNRMQETELTADQVTEIEALARFFRGLAYKNLAHLYGGVPLELDEVNEPKTGYTRATRDEVYQQAASDLEFAAQNLKGIEEVQDWEVNNLAAYHLLTEVFISLKRWNDAIQAASIVIDDPSTALMTERFGTRSGEPGDVYWDLFRRGNQNRSSGNTEAIMVWQYEVDVLGGVLESTSSVGPRLERNWAPLVGQLSYPDSDGIVPILAPRSDYTGGRGIGRCKPTRHYSHGVWQEDWDDMRNSEYNFRRELFFNNPASAWFGQKITEQPDWPFASRADDTIRWWYPYPTKVTTPGNHPDPLFEDKETLLLSGGGATYTDQYFVRLAETYLLRAEAYLGAEDPSNAAADINMVRNRANAINVSPSDIDIDYILDERIRELGPEELRRITLHRLGLVYDRVSRYAKPTGFRGNDEIMNDGFDVQLHHNLWPIPFSEIERNTDAVLEQNPGYAAE